MAYSFQPRNVYSFDVYPSTLLGTDFQNVTILGIIDYESAIALADIPALQSSYYPYLPGGTPSDASSYDYVHLRMPSGQKTVLAIPWINEASIVLVNARKITVELDGYDASVVDRIRVALVQNGFNNLKISVN